MTGSASFAIHIPFLDSPDNHDIKRNLYCLFDAVIKQRFEQKDRIENVIRSYSKLFNSDYTQGNIIETGETITLLAWNNLVLDRNTFTVYGKDSKL